MTLLAALACTPDPASTSPSTSPTFPTSPAETSETGTTGGTILETADTAQATGDTGGSTTTGSALAITFASVTCIDDFTVEFVVETDGLTLDGVAYEQETANYPPAQWSDSLTLESFESDPYGAWDHLHHQLRTAVDSGDYQPNVNTLFGCYAHYDPSADVMSYAVGVYDTTGALSDCVAWGHDPQGMMDGTAGTAVNPPLWDIGGCRVGAYDW